MPAPLAGSLVGLYAGFVEHARLASGEAPGGRTVRPPRILLVEDDPTIRQMTKLALERDGFLVATADDSAGGLAAYRAQPADLVLLDVMLPGVGGVEVCRAIRDQSLVPIVMLTARSDPVDVVLGLEAGADDYVTKPFEPAVLAARLRAVLRRAARHDASPLLRVGELEIDRAGMEVLVAGEPVGLTPTEYRLLRFLMVNAGRVVSKRQILDQVWEYDPNRDGSVVEPAVSYLRRKVDQGQPRLIHTVRGFGYVLRIPPP